MKTEFQGLPDFRAHEFPGKNGDSYCKNNLNLIPGISGWKKKQGVNRCHPLTQSRLQHASFPF